MYLSKKPPSPKYTLTPFLFLYVVSLMNGELFSTSSMDRLHVTLCIEKSRNLKFTAKEL